MKRYALTINGEAVVTENFISVPNPATGETVAEASVADEKLVDAAVEAAHAAFPAWRDLPDQERAMLLHKCADAVDAHAEELARLLSEEQGKPLNGAGSRFELASTVGLLRFTADLSLPTKVVQDDEQAHVSVHYEPLGVVASITPWNWPVMIAAGHFGPALRVGNTVVQKPSPFAPLSTMRLAEILNGVLPKGVLNVVVGQDAIGPALTGNPHVAKISFTGSTATGAKVMASGAASITNVTLELGGNDAAIVLPDCNAEEIAERLFWGAFGNNGQTCAAIKRLYVHDDIYEDVCAALVSFAAGIKVGNGLDETSILGPLQNRRQRDKVARLVDEARSAGARVLCGGERPDGPGNFYPITIVADATDDMSLVQEEQFGPALPVLRYKDVDDALHRANATDMGLGGSVWSPDIDRARALARRLVCGTAWINKHGLLRPDAPFGGRKTSGIGTQLGVEGLREFTSIQVLHD